MRFTESKDGCPRATVRVDFRIDLSAAAEALALEGMEAEMTAATATHVVTRASRKDVERALRGRLHTQGPPDHWTECGTEDPVWIELRELAGERVAELWPEATS